MTKDYDAAWYGTYKLSPDAPDPTPNSTLYPPDIYVSRNIEDITNRHTNRTSKDTYDPNWREFVG